MNETATPTGAVRISVVVCSYNRAAYIIDAVDSLFRQSLCHTLYEVWVVDNNSTDNTGTLVQAYIREHPGFRLFYRTEHKQGASFARNTGAAVASGDILCFMDDDAVASKDYLERMLQFFDQHPEAVGLGGRIIPRYIPAEPQWMSHYVSSMVGNFHYNPNRVVFAPGKYPLESNMAVRKNAFDAICGFNTALPGVQGELRIGGEGKDFFLRLQKNGAPVYYDPQLVVHHVVEVKKLTSEYLYRVASGYGRGEKVRTLAIGKMAYYKKIAEYLFKLGASIILGCVYALKGRPAQTVPIIRFRLDALKGLLE